MWVVSITSSSPSQWPIEWPIFECGASAGGCAAAVHEHQPGLVEVFVPEHDQLAASGRPRTGTGPGSHRRSRAAGRRATSVISSAGFHASACASASGLSSRPPYSSSRKLDARRCPRSPPCPGGSLASIAGSGSPSKARFQKPVRSGSASGGRGDDEQREPRAGPRAHQLWSVWPNGAVPISRPSAWIARRRRMYGLPSREGQPSMVIVSPGLTLVARPAAALQHDRRVGLGAPLAHPALRVGDVEHDRAVRIGEAERGDLAGDRHVLVGSK